VTKLRDQVVMVAGASGRLGHAVALQVLAAGGRVAAAVRKPWQVAKAQEAFGRERVLVGLVAPQDTEAAAGFAKGAKDALGPVTAFIGAAGAYAPRTAGHEPDGDLAAQLEANLLANATLARALLSQLRRGRRGTLLFVGAGPRSLRAGSVAFAAAKQAVHGFVEALAHDLEGSGVSVAAALPDADRLLDAAAIETLAAALLARIGEPHGGGPLLPLRG
jgi:NAD(P)-dependent dehydrogenase (short-subunit alcohol dehydrogenase family)